MVKRICRLLTVDNERTPTADRIARLIQEFRMNPPEAIARRSALVLPNDAFSGQADPPGWQFVKPYMDLIEGGFRPAVVLNSKSQDQEYLRSRGITELIHLK